MTRLLLRSRRAFAVGTLFLLAMTVTLSTATRRPCLRVCSGPWQTWKAGHMVNLEGKQAGPVLVKALAHTLQPARTAAPPSSPPEQLNPVEAVDLPACIVAFTRHLRAPPSLR